LAIVLFVFLRFTASGYHFSIKLFLRVIIATV